MMTPANKKKIQEDENIVPYHYVDLISEYSRLTWDIERRALMKVLKDELAPFVGQRILDAGCGDGRFCFELKDKKATVVGIDISEKAIAFARAFNPKGKFLVANLERPINLEKFDQIVCQETLEHIPPQKIKPFINNLDNLLSQNGKIVFTVPSNRLRVTKKHFRHFDTSSLEGLLQEHFVVGKIIGHNVDTGKRILFLIGRYLSAMLLPYGRKRIIVYKFCDLINRFYLYNLATGKPEDGLGLIAVCYKKL